MLKCVKFGVAVALIGLLSSTAWSASNKELKVDPTFTKPGEVVCAEGARPVTDQEKKEIEAVLADLYKACESKDLRQTMDILHECIEANAKEYVGRKLSGDEYGDKMREQAAQEIREAFECFFRDCFNNEEYALDPFNLEDIYYLIDEDEMITVSSSVPVISSTKGMTFFTSDESEYTIVRLRLGRFQFKKIDGRWRITNMDLF